MESKYDVEDSESRWRAVMWIGMLAMLIMIVFGLGAIRGWW